MLSVALLPALHRLEFDRSGGRVSSCDSKTQVLCF